MDGREVVETVLVFLLVVCAATTPVWFVSCVIVRLFYWDSSRRARHARAARVRWTVVSLVSSIIVLVAMVTPGELHVVASSFGCVSFFNAGGAAIGLAYIASRDTILDAELGTRYCFECLYELRGLPDDATVCPECGGAF